MINIYSPEPLNQVLSFNYVSNEAPTFTPVISRSCRNSKIYIKYSSEADVEIFLRKKYIENGEFKNIQNLPLIIPKNTDGFYCFPVFIINSNIVYDKNYIAYELIVNGLYNEATYFEITEIGLIFDDIISSKGHQTFFRNSLETDINNIPKNNQYYDKNVRFSIITNRARLTEITNVIEKPFYLVNVISECLDNSTEKLSSTGLSVNYVSSASKIVEVQLNNIGEY